jgi:predicted aspartyl protease
MKYKGNPSAQNATSKFVLNLSGNFTKVKIAGINTWGLVDTGAEISCINEEFVSQDKKLNQLEIQKSKFGSVQTADGSPLGIKGKITLTIVIEGRKIVSDFHVITNLKYDVIIGMDILKKQGATINLTDDKLTFSKHTQIRALSTTIIPPYSERVFHAKIQKPLPTGIQGICMHGNKLLQLGIYGAKTLSVIHLNKVPVRFINPTKRPVTIYNNTNLGSFHVLSRDECISELMSESTRDIPAVNHISVDETQTLNHTTVTAKLPFNVDLHSGDLTEKQQSAMVELLYKNKDIFATQTIDLGYSTLVPYEIKTKPGAVPVASRPYRYGPAQEQFIEERIKEMLQANIIRPSTSPYASPIVLVKKKDQGGTRICIDYRLLNLDLIHDTYFCLELMTL